MNSQDDSSTTEMVEPKHSKLHCLGIAGLGLRSLGIIYGDIGTSPLYVFHSVFANNSEPTAAEVIGVASLIVWSLLLMVTLKYVGFIIQADNDGEGGTFALCSLLLHEKSTMSKGKTIVVFASLVGAGFVIADGVLTPSISILSSVEGLKTFDSNFDQKYIVIIATLLLVLLFMVQGYGTSQVGIAFGPVMLLWFTSLFSIGIYRITLYPRVFSAFNPANGISYLFSHGTEGFLHLGSVFLAITGLEALYADLGHFGRTPIRVSWLLIVLPSLTCNYLGQGALIVHDRRNLSNPFFESIPHQLYWPMFVLAIISAIIASQAMITGCFSLASQATSLGYLPPMKIQHTSKKIAGQIYVPVVNYLLMILCIVVVAGFQESGTIGHAYGVTVCGVMILTTCLYTLVMHYRWHLAWWKIFPFGIFLIIDTIYFASNIAKIPSGGWVSLLLGSTICTVMIAWHMGQDAYHKLLEDSVPLIPRSAVNEWMENPSSVQEHVSLVPGKSIELKDIEFAQPTTRSIKRSPGMGVFLTTKVTDTLPLVFVNIAAKIDALPECIVFLTVESVHVPFVDEQDRTTVTRIGDNIYQLVLRIGFAESKYEVGDAFKIAQEGGLAEFPSHEITYFSLHVHIEPVHRVPPMRLLYSCYAFQKRVFSGFPSCVIVPPESHVELGIRVSL